MDSHDLNNEYKKIFSILKEEEEKIKSLSQIKIYETKDYNK